MGSSFIRQSIVLMAILVLFPLLTFACVSSPSGGPPPFCYSYSRADAIFLAEVAVNPVALDDSFESVTFKVREWFKGERLDEITVLNKTKEFTSCDSLLKPRKGEVWIVYTFTHAGRHYVSEDSFRDYSSLYRDNHLKYLRNVAARGQPPEICGRIVRFPYGISQRKMRGILVQISGQGIKRTVRTDRFGSFAFSSIPEGEYLVSLKFPFRVSVLSDNPVKVASSKNDRTLSYSANAKKNACEYRPTLVRLKTG